MCRKSGGKPCAKRCGSPLSSVILRADRLWKVRAEMCGLPHPPPSTSSSNFIHLNNNNNNSNKTEKSGKEGNYNNMVTDMNPTVEPNPCGSFESQKDSSSPGSSVHVVL